MGNLCSTRWHGHTPRPVTDEVPSLCVARIRGLDRLRPQRTVVVVTPEGPPRRHIVSLEPHAQPFGGYRWWFLCPRCQTPRHRLYEMVAGLMCRSCGGLRYRTSRMDGLTRSLRRAHLAVIKGGYSPEDAASAVSAGSVPARRKKMHRRRYQQMTVRFSDAVATHLAKWLASTQHRFPTLLLEVTHEQKPLRSTAKRGVPRRVSKRRL